MDSTRPEASDTQLRLARLGADGALLWTKSSRAVGPEPPMHEFMQPTAIAASADGTLYLAGDSWGGLQLEDCPVSDPTPFIAALDSAGHCLWLQNFTGTEGVFYSVAPHPEGGVVASGTLYLSANFGGQPFMADGRVGLGEGSVAFAIRLGSEGDLRWSFQDSAPFGNRAGEVAVDAEGNAYAGFGLSRGAMKTELGVVTSFDVAGEVRWSRDVLLRVSDHSPIDGLAVAPDGSVVALAYGRHVTLRP